MFVVCGAPYYDIIGDISSSYKSLKSILNGILKDFTGGVNSKRKSFVAKQTTMSDEGGDRARFFVWQDLVIARFEINFAEFCGTWHVLQ